MLVMEIEHQTIVDELILFSDAVHAWEAKKKELESSKQMM